MIRGLTVFHVAKAGGLRAPAEGWERAAGIPGAAPVWRLDTCQRWLAVTHGTFAFSPATLPTGVEVFQGAAAYEFLLEVATGLASQLAGETNILGQLKSAWNAGSARAQWLQWLFADAKEIRAQYLAEVGGASYGRGVRQLLRQAGGPDTGSILLLGAGELADAIGPWLRFAPLQLLNRTPARATALANRLRQHPGAPVEVVPPDAAETAWSQARAIVLCVPFAPAEDELRLAWSRAAAATGCSAPVVHLGGHRAQAGSWNSLPQFLCLDELFARQHRADDHRDRQLARAAVACAERARHRSLGHSLSHPHGWEDLPQFFPITAFPLGAVHLACRQAGMPLAA
jgi:hypothetical protein